MMDFRDDESYNEIHEHAKLLINVAESEHLPIYHDNALEFGNFEAENSIHDSLFTKIVMWMQIQ